MSTYHYPEAKLIEQAMFETSEKGAHRAYLHATAQADVQKLHDLTCRLQKTGFQCIPCMHAGKPALEVRGFKRDVEVLACLVQDGAVQGQPKVTTLASEKISFKDKVKKRTLQASGLFYAVGDYNFFTYGRKGASWEDMMAGIMYAGGTVSLVGYGRNDQSDIQVKDLSKRITQHLIREVKKLPPDCLQVHESDHGPQSMLGKVDGVFRRYPSEMFNLFTGLAGACIAAAAVRHKVINVPDFLKAGQVTVRDRQIYKNAGFLDVGLGTLTMASTAIGGLVKEKVADPDKPKSEGAKAVLEWVQEKPLAIAGAGLMLSTLCHAVSSVIEYRLYKRLNLPDKVDSIKNRAWFVATNLAAEMLIMMSSKGHGEGVKSDESVDKSVIALAADLIVKQPERYQPHLIEYLSVFLGRPDVLAMKDGEVKERLRTEVAALRSNPWMGATQARPRQLAAAATPPLQKDAPVWQAKALAADTSPQQSPRL